MPLAIFTMVLVGVMGAGLLTFVATDLTAVAEANQGQRAFEMADAGVKAAKEQLNEEPSPDSYDGGTGDVDWSYSTGGKDLTMNGDSVNVAIEYESAGDSFLVISTGEAGNAMRRVEAVFEVVSSGSGGGAVPPLVTTPLNINVNGGLTLRDTAMFAGGNIDLSQVGKGNYTFENSSVFAGGNIDWVAYDNSLPNTQDLYGNWQRGPNSTARPNTLMGVGALKRVGSKHNAWNKGCSTEGVPSWSSMHDQLGKRIFDQCTNPSLVENPGSPQPSSEITFPFDTYRDSNGRLRAGVEPDIEALRQKAQADGTYYTPAPDKDFRIKDSGAKGGDVDLNWPASSTLETVVFISFSSGSNSKVRYSVGNSCNKTVQGILVIEGADLNWQANSNSLEGAVIVKRGVTTTDAELSSQGNFCLKGYAYSDGAMNLQGNSMNFGPPPDTDDLPGFTGAPPTTDVELQSWRELYE
jgi:hypothetical protein